MTQNKLNRNRRISFYLNEKEYKVFLKYVKKYKVKNKAKFIRTLVIKHILEQFDKDYPTLFDKNNN